jgi:hypothetical protein
MKNATYVEAARWGKYRGWRYPLGLVIILFAWLVVGSGASVLVAFALGGQADPSVLGSVEYYLFVMASFLFFFAGVIIAVSLIHRRPPRTLVTARERIDWHRVGQGFVAWFVPYCLIGGLGQYLFYPDTFSFNSDLLTFTLFVLGVHFANNIGGALLFNITGSALPSPALFTISEYHTTYGALAVLVAVPVFLAIAYGVFKQESPQSVSQSHQKGRW